MAKFRLRDNTRIVNPVAECENFIGRPLQDVLSLFTEHDLKLFKDFEGKNGYRLITMTGLLRMIEIIAHRQNDTEKWMVVDVIIQLVLQRH
ncbi:MAG: hypothetical protein J5629_02155 [Muribaculaceae bacterium]|nr:hypothetical protein [Muribaculaceae bacterium]